MVDLKKMSLISKIQALKEQVYYVAGLPNMSPYADAVNKKIDDIIFVVLQHHSIVRGELVDRAARAIAAFEYDHAADGLYCNAGAKAAAVIEAVINYTKSPVREHSPEQCIQTAVPETHYDKYFPFAHLFNEDGTVKD